MHAVYKPMRILYFSRDFTTHDHRFLSALARTGHRIYYLRLEGGAQVLEERPLPAEIETVEWSGGKRPARLSHGFQLLDDLRRVIRQVKPDLIHAGPIQRCAFLAALTGFHPLVSMSWGYDLLHDAHRNSFWRWATRYTLKHSDAFVGDCNTIRDLAISCGMDKNRIVIFPWGIDLQHFNLATSKRDNVQTFSLLSTRNFEPIYGIDVIARAFVIAARQRPELRLTLLGGGSQWAPIRQILLVGGVFDRVQFPGLVSFSELPAYHQDADIYVCASHSDGTSISLLEAFACGKPAIVSDIPGNREWIAPGENGWLFPDGDAAALADTILHAMDQRQNLSVMGQNARRIAENRADWEKNFTQLEKAYALALG
ncbi:MAG TPA: glycosyltransferase family 4 protein [Anaerolineales bacterium]|nr:glycosyltransferase family 4 protein [Anaerolineales bacterium]